MGCFASKPREPELAISLQAREHLLSSLAAAGDATLPSEKQRGTRSTAGSVSEEGDAFDGSSRGGSCPPSPSLVPTVAVGQRTLEVASSAIKRTHHLRVGVLEGTTFLNQYTVLDTLGRGSFGKVKRCLNTADDELYAVKIVSRRQLKASHRGGMGGASTSDALSTLRREIEVMTGLSHPNLVRLVEVIDDVGGGRLLLVMEYAAAGQLVARGTLSPERRMPEVIAQFYFRQMAAGMAHLHAHHVVHGDMKPDNVLLSGDATVKIADFGQARFFDVRDTFRRTRGTPAFLAPEICAGEDYRGRQADMWALGVSLYQFVYGQLPFEADSPAQLYDLIATGDVPYPEGVPVSIELQDLFRRILCPVPEGRLTAQDMMQHVWVVGDQWIEALSASLRQGGGEELVEAADPDQVAAVVFPPDREPGAEEEEGVEPGVAQPLSPSPMLGRDLDAAVAFWAEESGLCAEDDGQEPGKEAARSPRGASPANSLPRASQSLGREWSLQRLISHGLEASLPRFERSASLASSLRLASPPSTPRTSHPGRAASVDGAEGASAASAAVADGGAIVRAAARGAAAARGLRGSWQDMRVLAEGECPGRGGGGEGGRGLRWRELRTLGDAGGSDEEEEALATIGEGEGEGESRSGELKREEEQEGAAEGDFLPRAHPPPSPRSSLTRRTPSKLAQPAWPERNASPNAAVGAEPALDSGGASGRGLARSSLGRPAARQASERSLGLLLAARFNSGRALGSPFAYSADPSGGGLAVSLRRQGEAEGGGGSLPPSRVISLHGSGLDLCFAAPQHARSAMLGRASSPGACASGAPGWVAGSAGGASLTGAPQASAAAPHAVHSPTPPPLSLVLQPAGPSASGLASAPAEASDSSRSTLLLRSPFDSGTLESLGGLVSPATSLTLCTRGGEVRGGGVSPLGSQSASTSPQRGNLAEIPEEAVFALEDVGGADGSGDGTGSSAPAPTSAQHREPTSEPRALVWGEQRMCSRSLDESELSRARSRMGEALGRGGGKEEDSSSQDASSWEPLPAELPPRGGALSSSAPLPDAAFPARPSPRREASRLSAAASGRSWAEARGASSLPSPSRLERLGRAISTGTRRVPVEPRAAEPRSAPLVRRLTAPALSLGSLSGRERRARESPERSQSARLAAGQRRRSASASAAPPPARATPPRAPPPPPLRPVEFCSFAAGEELVLISTAQAALFYIEQGEVDLRFEVDLADVDSFLCSALGSCQGLALLDAAPSLAPGASAGARGEEAAALELDAGPAMSHALDSLALDLDIADAQLDPRRRSVAADLAPAAAKVAALVAGARQGIANSLLATRRGRAQFVGVLGLLDPSFFVGRWRVRAVARTRVEALRMSAEGLELFLEQNPLAQVHLRASLSLAQAEIARLDALQRVADCMQASSKRARARRAAAAAVAQMGPEEEAEGGAREAEEAEPAAQVLAGSPALGAATLAPPAREARDEGSTLDRFAFVSWLRDVARG